ncbi:hypothetical protein PSENEW3_00005890 [Picochlorum sp. SENEW3]|nr:hypothetical protein PSENEW3_00005890 [Picochlorum sp. SENEW3]|mmetsp:Transcript_2090/g.4314  ORF Transcript_2090/g.4314 Transcript_2090/m.4314 type:complete len:100 (+) Transcript_2090:3-302(+)
MNEEKSVPKRVEEALFYKLKQRAFVECSEYSRAYAECCKGRVISMVWACREESRHLSDCMSRYTSRLNDLKAHWVACGSLQEMTEAQWNMLLDELLHDG